ncbi:arylesterase [Parazoarcus communis]|uniref:Arylesterase n=1 Tax=Parazoarcus communis TaxID=41977 RepID=A0A2U8GW57_9RHOO|nr:arylesterase [Parazoarcus communis]AWI77503.1 arylesterase [Parazoarcus communis]
MPLRSMLTFLLFLFAGAAQAATIMVWGDSLSAGYGLKAEEAWPTLLQTRLESEGFPHRVVNASVSGETSAGGRSRLPAALNTHKPDVVIIELGANDGLRGLPTKLLAANLDAMVSEARKAGSKVLLVGMQMPPNYGPAYTRSFTAAYAEVARATGVPLVPFLLEGFADRPEFFLSDGIHPTAEAQFQVLDTVWASLKPMLGQATAKR